MHTLLIRKHEESTGKTKVWITIFKGMLKKEVMKWG
jgi:hypothetical protein